MDGTLDIGFLWSLLRRRWPLLVAPVILLTPIALGLAYILPPIYAASARAIVQSQQIPEQLVQSTVDTRVAEAVAFIQQRLMTRQVLLDIAAEHRVANPVVAGSPSEVIELMRRSVSIRTLRLGGGGVNGVEISFESSNPRKAADVANEFLDRLLTLNLQTRNARATETSTYFRQEVQRLGEELTRLERRITEFKQQNQDALPDSLSFRRSELADLEQRVFERGVRKIALEEERKRLADALRTGDYAAAGATPLSAEQRELERLRNALAQQSTLYSQAHPSIRSLQARIAALESVVIDVQETAAEADPDAPADGADELRQMMAQIDEEIRLLDERRTEEEARIEALGRSIERTPEVEFALNELQREYGSIRSQYQSNVSKLAEAEAGERLEVNQKGQRFEVVERAEVPSSPDFPPRLMIAAGGFVAASGLGVGLMLLAEMLNRSLRTAADMERQLDMRPLAIIPYIWTERQLAMRRLKLRVAALVLVVVVPASLYAVDQYYLPLPLLAERLMDRTGLDTFVSMIEARFGGRSEI